MATRHQVFAPLSRSGKEKARAAARRQNKRALKTNSTRWRHIRAVVLSMEPVCRLCWDEGRTTPANEVDHIDGDPGNNAMENLQALCKPCHSAKTISENPIAS